MPKITMNCPKCGEPQTVDATVRGKDHTCSKCEAPFTAKVPRKKPEPKIKVPVVEGEPVDDKETPKEKPEGTSAEKPAEKVEGGGFLSGLNSPLWEDEELKDW